MGKSGNFISGMFIGALVGAGLALLFTPTPGTSMRGQLAGYFEKVKSEVDQAAQNRRAELENQLTKLRHVPPPG